MTALIGILNITPDSFSDGGQWLQPEAALAHMQQMLRDGAQMVDVGAESTRPGAEPLSAEEEWARLEPVLSHPDCDISKVSLDTRHAETARRALELGVAWINDVTGFTDPQMRKAVAGHEGLLVLMHALSIPADPRKVLLESNDPVAEVMAFFRQQLELLQADGIPPARIILDPGIGFGKTAEQSITLLARWQEFRALGCPVLIGHSRKSFMKLLSDEPAPARDGLTRAVSALLTKQGVAYLRVHDVAGHAAMLRELHG